MAAELHAVRMDLNTKRGGWVRRCRVADDGVAAEGLEKTEEGTFFDNVFTPLTSAVASFLFRPSTHPLNTLNRQLPCWEEDSAFYPVID